MHRFKRYLAPGYLFITVCASVINAQQTITITGTVVDSVTSSAIASARVALLEVPSCTTLTDATGAFTLTTAPTRTLDSKTVAIVSGQISLREGVLSIEGQEAGAKVSVDAFAVNGSRVAHREKTASSTGNVGFEALRGPLALYSYRVRVGSNMYTLSNLESNATLSTRSLANSAPAPLAKASAGTYTVMASKSDYNWKQVAMTSTVGSLGQLQLSSCHCSDIAAANGWQKITPPGSIGDAQDLALDPLSSGTIYVQMHKGGNGAHYPTDGLYKSTNCGSTWNRVPQGRNSSDPGTNFNSGSVSGFVVDPINPNVMWVVSNYGPGGIFKSTNGGVDWDQKFPDSLAQYVPMDWWCALTMDPTNHNHLIAANHTGCTGPYAPNAVAETKDGGVSWELDKLPIGWAEGNSVSIKDSLRMLFSTSFDGVYATGDDGLSWSKVGPGGNGIAYQSLSGTSYLAGCNGAGVLSSSDFVHWNQIAGSGYRNLVGTGTHLIGTAWYSFDYSIASEGAPATWTSLTVPNTPTGGNGGVYMQYEKQNHLVYSANYDVGLWRLVHD